MAELGINPRSFAVGIDTSNVQIYCAGMRGDRSVCSDRNILSATPSAGVNGKIVSSQLNKHCPSNADVSGAHDVLRWMSHAHSPMQR